MRRHQPLPAAAVDLDAHEADAERLRRPRGPPPRAGPGRRRCSPGSTPGPATASYRLSRSPSIRPPHPAGEPEPQRRRRAARRPAARRAPPAACERLVEQRGVSAAEHGEVDDHDAPASSPPYDEGAAEQVLDRAPASGRPSPPSSRTPGSTIDDDGRGVVGALDVDEAAPAIARPRTITTTPHASQRIRSRVDPAGPAVAHHHREHRARRSGRQATRRPPRSDQPAIAARGPSIVIGSTSTSGGSVRVLSSRLRRAASPGPPARSTTATRGRPCRPRPSAPGRKRPVGKISTSTAIGTDRNAPNRSRNHSANVIPGHASSAVSPAWT